MVTKLPQRLLNVRVITGVIALVLLFGSIFLWHFRPAYAAAGINETINYQARLLTSTGATVPDGSYNIEFKIYQDGDGVLGGGDESLKWTETRTGSNKVVVKNGYFSVYLGSVTPFANNIDWNQNTLWLSVNIGGTGIPSYDGEMSPFTRFSSTPYALNSKYLSGLSSAQFLQLAQGVQSDSSTTNASLAINKTGSTANILQIQKGGSDVFLMDNNGLTTFKPSSDNSQAFKIQNASANETLLSVDTASRGVSGGNIVKIGNSTGTDGATTILQVDSATADPTSNLSALSGGIFYNSTSNKMKIIENGVIKTLCNTTDAGCGAGGSTSLSSAYTNGSAGDQIITLSGTNDSLIVSNPASSGTASAFTLQVRQLNTTAAVSGLDISQSSNNANGANISANSIDNETGLSISVNALTSGRGLTIDSSSTAFTGSLAEITSSGSSASNVGNILKLSSTGVNSATTGLYIDHRATGTGNLALRIDDQAGDTSPFIVDGDGRVGIGTSTITGTTERLLQVGSPTNRGNAAVYGELVSKGVRGLSQLSNIKDIYIYDTTSDSDGGRWIDWATTDKLGWYNETLDDSPSNSCNPATMDRCYSQAFPRKAALVVTSDALYIFDLQNNVMWMKFSQNDTGWALGANTNNDPSSVTAANGVVYVGTNGSSAGGLYAFDFTTDRMWNYDTTDRSGADVGISGRNGSVVYNSDNNTNFDIGTVGTVADWGKINDVSAAVLTNSLTPIAATTGPNNGTTVIGLATDSGLTVINTATQKVFQYSDATDNDYNAVTVTKTGRLYALNEALGQLERWNNIDNENIATRVNGTPDRVFDETTTPALSKSAPTVLANAPDALEVVERGSLADGGVLSTATVPGSSDLIYVGTNQGLTEIHDHSTAASAWSKFYNNTGQTMLMPATIRRAHMFNNTSGNVTNQSNKTSIMVAKGTPTYGVDGVRGKAMSFNGTSQYLCSDANADGTCDNDTTDNMSTGSWTISTWFKHSTTISGTDVLFARCYNATPAATAGCVAASMTSTGTMAVNVDFDATWTIGATGTTVFHNSVQTFNDNQWHFLEVTRAATTGNINTIIDGKPIGQTAGLNTTLDATQIFSIGTDCSTGANCTTGGNFWDGQVDDFEYNSTGSTGTTDNITPRLMGRLYNDARPLLSKKVYDGANDTVSYTSTAISDSSSPNWVPNELAGLLVKISSGTGSGQTRRIVSNTTNSITVYPAFSTTPASNDDFNINPEALNGSTNNVTAIGITAESPIGEARMLCAGTNDGADGGGVTCFNHQAGPNLVADLYHNKSAQFDDSNNEWNGTNFNNIVSVDFSGRSLVMGSTNHLWFESQDVKLGQGLDYLASQLFNLRSQVLNLGITTLAGSTGLEVGFTGGADLAERYTSDDNLTAGDIVTLDANNVGAVKKSTLRYQSDMIGIVSTEPGATLGPDGEKAYPIALVGRVPVKVTTENGDIKSGDRITSSSIAGYGMKAVNGGRVVGTALDDLTEDKYTECPQNAPEDIKCGTITVFVNLVDYSGANTENQVSFAENNGLLLEDSVLSPVAGLISWNNNLSTDQKATQTEQLSKADKVLRYLAGRKVNNEDKSEVLTDQVSSGKVNTSSLYANNIFAANITVDKLRANQIEGLELFTDKIASLSQKQKDASTSADTQVTEQRNINNDQNNQVEQLEIKSAKVALDLSINGSLFANGGLTVNGDAEFKGNVVMYKLVTFIEKSVFNNDVSFVGKATFNSDSAGFAVIKKDKKEIEVKFDKPYDNDPIVTVSVRDGQFVNYSYTDLSKDGFKIILKDPAEKDIKFSWTAVSIKDARTVHYDDQDKLLQR